MEADRQHTSARAAGEDLVYSATARLLHWLTVLFVAMLIPMGLYMVWRGNVTNFDAATNTLYNAHKLGGFLLLWVVVARLAYRFTRGAPPDEPTLEPWQRVASHLTHWGIYALLLVVPFFGWLGVSLYGARDVLGGFRLPAIAGEDQKAATLVFLLHYWAAMLLLAAIAAHVGAAIYHHFIRGDGVLRRMLPGLKKRA